MKVRSIAAFFDLRWDCVGCDIRNQKNEQRPSHAELWSFHVFTLLSPDQCVLDRHSESRGKRNMCEKDICYWCTQLFRVYRFRNSWLCFASTTYPSNIDITMRSYEGLASWYDYDFCLGCFSCSNRTPPVDVLACIVEKPSADTSLMWRFYI